MPAIPTDRTDYTLALSSILARGVDASSSSQKTDYALALSSILARDVDHAASSQTDYALALSSILARNLDYASRTLHTAGNLLMRRDEDNHVAEVIGVVIGIFVIVGAIFYWGIHKDGSCEFRAKKR